MLWKKQCCKHVTILILIAIILLMGDNVLARKYFMMERPELDFKFSYEIENEERSGPNLNREDSTMTFFEGFNISAGGWVYHPALLSYKFEFIPQWEQLSQKTEPDEKIKSRNFLEGYLTEVTILQHKPYTFRLFADRTRSTINSNFAQRSKNETSTYGTSVLLKYMVLPTTFDYTHSDSRQTGFFDTDEETDLLQIQMRYFGHLGDTRLKASWKDTNTDTRGQRLGIKEQKVDLTNHFAVNSRGAARTNLGYRLTEGDFFELERYNFTENFSWKHRKNMSTNYSYRYVKSNFETTTSESNALGFNLKHLLYENLTTTINANGSNNKYTGGSENEYGGGVNFDYVRRIPWGRLNLHSNHNYQVTEEEKTGNNVGIQDESQTLTIGGITVLDNNNADTSTIQVRNVLRTILYQEDVDYRVTESGSSVRIICIPGSLLDTGLNCSTGAPVVVDYSFISDPALDFATFTRGYGIKLNLWSVWNLYYSYNRRTEEFLAGNEPDVLIDDIINSAGTDVTWKWSKTGFAFRDSDTINLPTREWDLTETLTFRPTENIFLSFLGRYGETEFKDTLETETFSSLTSSLQVLISRKSRLTVRGSFHEVEGSLDNIVNTGFSAIYEIAYRRLRGSVQYGFSDEDDKKFGEKVRNHYFMVEVKTSQF